MMDRRRFLGLSAMALVAGCSSHYVAPGPAATPVGPYTLAAGDKLRITVFGEPTLTGEYTVTGGGAISFPLIGNVPAAGKTVERLQADIQKSLAAGYFADPRVSAEIIDYRPYYVLGEVTRPGEYPYSIGLTIDQAIATAGGYTYRANQNKIYVKHALETAERLVDLGRQRSFPVSPGDTFRVGERFF